MYKTQILKVALIGIAIAGFNLTGCSKDNIDINIENTIGNKTDPNGNSSGGNSGDTTSTATKQTKMLYTADLISLQTKATTTSEFPANRLVTIFAYSAGTKVTSQEYTSGTTAGTLSPSNGTDMQLATGTYSLYSVGINKATTTPPAFTSSTSMNVINGTDYIWWSTTGVVIEGQGSYSQKVTYEHCCAQIVVKVDTANSVSIASCSGMTITPTNDTNSTWNLLTGDIATSTTLSSDSVAMGVTIALGEIVSQYIMVPYSGTTNLSCSFTLILDGESTARSYHVSLPYYSGNFTAGNSYVYTLELTQSGIEFIDVEIDNWVDVTVNSTPIIPSQVS